MSILKSAGLDLSIKCLFVCLFVCLSKIISHIDMLKGKLGSDGGTFGNTFGLVGNHRVAHSRIPECHIFSNGNYN